MSGFDARKVDRKFFAYSTWKANFRCGIGRGDQAKIFERLPRRDFSDVAETL